MRRQSLLLAMVSLAALGSHCLGGSILPGAPLTATDPFILFVENANEFENLPLRGTFLQPGTLYVFHDTGSTDPEKGFVTADYSLIQTFHLVLSDTIIFSGLVDHNTREDIGTFVSLSSAGPSNDGSPAEVEGPFFITNSDSSSPGWTHTLEFKILSPAETTPEPSSLVLAAIAAPALFVAFARRWKRDRDDV
jgi:hypothetical protein